mmetsp:Transcript_14268/g.32412  ORF Transcript_14268/g.32412 Transcript_14268/m.32412 type:complete len:169 (+) Transcript_14268:83-589(+)
MKTFRILLCLSLILACFLSPQVVAEESECAAGECQREGSAILEEEMKQEEEIAVADDMETVASEEVPMDPNCPNRDHLVRCAAEHLDKNKNGKLDRNELDDAVASLPWYARGLLNILGSVNKMMQKCDVDGDGAISIDYDMQNNKETCLATCFKRRAFKGAFFPECDL